MADPIRLKPDVTWQQLDGEVVALDLASAVYVMANDTGSILWPLLEEGATDSELASVLVDRFGIDAERAGADVAAFVAQLRALTLVD